LVDVSKTIGLAGRQELIFDLFFVTFTTAKSRNSKMYNKIEDCRKKTQSPYEGTIKVKVG